MERYAFLASRRYKTPDICFQDLKEESEKYGKFDNV